MIARGQALCSVVTAMQIFRIVLVAAFSLGVLWPVTVSAQQASTLQQGTVSAQRADTLSSAKISVERDRAARSAVPLQSLISLELQRRGVATLSEAVRSFSGVNVKDYGGIGGLKTVSVRGLGAQHTAVIYDGITVSDAQNGMVDIGRFNIENLGSVSMSIAGEDDIFRSARQMSSAGALILVSRKPFFTQRAGSSAKSQRDTISRQDSEYKSTNAIALLRAASFGTVNPYLLVEQRLAKGWAASVSANYMRTDGGYPFMLQNGSLVTREKRLNSDVESISSEANVYGKLGLGDLAFKLSWFGSERGLPGSVVLYTQNPTERLWDRNLSAHAVYETERGRWKMRAGLGYDWSWNRYTNSSALYPEPLDDRYSQREYSASGILQARLGERWKLAFAEDAFVNTLDSNLPDFCYPRRISSVSALSTAFEGERLKLIAGLSLYLSHESVRSGEPAPDRSRLSPSVSASYLIRDGLRIRASWRDGYRVPSFNDLYYARIGNTALRPEKASQTNLGITWSGSGSKGSFSLSADTYYNFVKDKIYAIPTLFIWKMHNVGSAQIVGSDLNARGVVNAAEWLRIRLGAGYSWQYAVDVSDPEAKNYCHQIPYIPRHSGNASAVFETPWVNFAYTLNASGRRYALPQNTESSTVPGYADHSLSLNRDFVFQRLALHLSAEVLNLSGVNYQLVQYYPMAGRQFRFTIKISY